MSLYPHPRNTSVMHASGAIEALRPLSGDERRADWAQKFYGMGLHRGVEKPRIRLSPREPAALARSSAGDPNSAAAADVQASSHDQRQSVSHDQLLPAANAARTGSQYRVAPSQS